MAAGSWIVLQSQQIPFKKTRVSKQERKNTGFSILTAEKEASFFHRKSATPWFWNKSKMEYYMSMSQANNPLKETKAVCQYRQMIPI